MWGRRQRPRPGRVLLWTALLVVGLGAARPETTAAPPVMAQLGRDLLPLPKPAPEDETTSTDGAGGEDDRKNEDDREPGAPAASSRYTPSMREVRFDGGAGRRLLVIEIEGVIDLGLAPFIERVVDDAEEAGDVVALVSVIDTPGGRVDAAVRIRDRLLRSKVKTIAFVNPAAISAGALIAYAHDFIVVTEGASMGAATPIQMGGGGQAEPVEEKIVSYMRSVMRATAEAKGRDGAIAEAMVDRTLAVPGVIEAGKLLTATTRELLDFGVADLQAADLDELRAKMMLTEATIVRPELSWAELIARFLTHPVTSSLLMTLGFLGLLMELYTPGFGLAGGVGIACLLLFFAGHLVVKLAGWEEVLLFLGGLGFLAVELFLTPGFGVFGVLGIVCVIISLVLALVGLPLRVSFDSGEMLIALGRVSLAGIFTAVVAVLLIKFLPRTAPGRRIVLAAVAARGGPATLDRSLGSASSERPKDAEAATGLVGREGTAMTDCRPAGRALIGGNRFDVVTDGEFINKGDRVIVVEASALRVLVRPRRAKAGSAGDGAGES